MLKTRVITAFILLISVVLGVLYASSFVWQLAWAGVILGLGGWEWARLHVQTQSVKNKNLLPITYGSSLFVAGLFLNQALFQPLLSPLLAVLCSVCVAFCVILVPIWLIKKLKIIQSVWSLLLGILILFPLYLVMLAADQIFSSVSVSNVLEGRFLLVFMTSILWVSDSAAYFTGKAFGKHKLAPSISPGKTWEGVMGALFFSVCYLFAASALFALPSTAHYVPHLSQQFGAFSTVFLVLLVLCMVVAGVAGDLLESLCKRQASMKDSSQILPGHGGILDRIDAPLLAVPLGAALLWFYYAYISIV